MVEREKEVFSGITRLLLKLDNINSRVNSIKTTKNKKTYDPTKYVRGDFLINKPEFDKDKGQFSYKDFVERQRTQSILETSKKGNDNNNKGGDEGFSGGIGGGYGGNSFNKNEDGFSNSKSNNIVKEQPSSTESNNKKSGFEIDKSIHNPYEMIEMLPQSSFNKVNQSNIVNNNNIGGFGQPMNQSNIVTNQFNPTLGGLNNTVNQNYSQLSNFNLLTHSNINNLNNVSNMNMNNMNNISNNLNMNNINNNMGNLNSLNNQSNNFNQFQNQFSQVNLNQNSYVGQSMMNQGNNMLQNNINNTISNKIPNQSDIYSYNNYPKK